MERPSSTGLAPRPTIHPPSPRAPLPRHVTASLPTQHHHAAIRPSPPVPRFRSHRVAMQDNTWGKPTVTPSSRNHDRFIGRTTTATIIIVQPLRGCRKEGNALVPWGKPTAIVSTPLRGVAANPRHCNNNGIFTATARATSPCRADRSDSDL